MVGTFPREPVEIGDGVIFQTRRGTANETGTRGFFADDFPVLAIEAKQKCCFACVVAFGNRDVTVIGQNTGNVLFGNPGGECFAAKGRYRRAAREHHVVLGLDICEIDVREKQISAVRNVGADIAGKELTAFERGIPAAIEHSVA